MPPADAQPAARDHPPFATIPTAHVPDRPLVPERTMRCRRCGVTIHPAALQHDQVLLLAACCPRCDGPLIDEGAVPSPAAVAR